VEKGLPQQAGMKLVLLGAMTVATLFAQSPDEERAADLNVNSRYTVESISFTDEHHYRLSNSALDEMHRLIGARLNTEALNRLARKICGEVRAHQVTFKVARGGAPESVKVLLTVDKGVGNFDLSIPQFSFNSRQGWTGMGQAATSVGANQFTFAMLSDGDTLTERFAGLQAKFARPIGSDGIRVGFEFDAYHVQYNPATLAALDNSSSITSSSLGAGAYSSRLNFEPSATFVLASPLTLSVGLGFEELKGDLTAARSESANAVINSLRYHQRWEDSDATKQELDAGYSLRAATKLLGTDLAYTRHYWKLRYAYVRDRQSVEVKLAAGAIFGQAPLFERFSLGDSSMLRGWNKYDIDPLGGNRLAYGSVTYGYRMARVFYDAGSVWDQGRAAEARQSIGAGVVTGLGFLQKDAFLIALAFPFRQGHVDPVLVAGMNF
jgi:outer membrane protein assembly factor BamA